MALETPNNETKNDAEQQRDGDFGQRDERGVSRFVRGQIPRFAGRDRVVMTCHVFIAPVDG
ncbi:MAG: hypothetical protein ABSF67_15575 [Roseiarcus sp.]